MNLLYRTKVKEQNQQYGTFLAGLRQMSLSLSVSPRKSGRRGNDCDGKVM